jgi:hypothetical protein
MACGTPVIASRAASIPEVLGDAGVLLDPDDEPGWADAIAAVVSDEWQKGRMRKAGLTRAKEFTWARTASITLDGVSAGRGIRADHEQRPDLVNRDRQLERPAVSRAVSERRRCAARRRRRDDPRGQRIVDGTAAFVRERFPWVRLVALTENRGYAGGNNAGAREARGRFIVLLNNDTVPEPGWLAALLRGREAGGPNALASSRVVYMHDPQVIDSAGDGCCAGAAPSSGITARASSRQRSHVKSLACAAQRA